MIDCQNTVSCRRRPVGGGDRDRHRPGPAAQVSVPAAATHTRAAAADRPSTPAPDREPAGTPRSAPGAPPDRPAAPTCTGCSAPTVRRRRARRRRIRHQRLVAQQVLVQVPDAAAAHAPTSHRSLHRPRQRVIAARVEHRSRRLVHAQRRRRSSNGSDVREIKNEQKPRSMCLACRRLPPPLPSSKEPGEPDPAL